MKFAPLIVLLLGCLAVGVFGAHPKFIVIGGGTAGCAIAARLSEDVNVRVLLLADGDDESASPYNQVSLVNPIVGLPTDYPRFADVILSIEGPSIGRRSQTALKPRVLGGGSTVNGIASNFPANEDYLRLASIGVTGWDLERIGEIRRSIETYHVYGNDTATLEGHGTSGPIHMRTIPSETYLSAFTNSVRAVTGTAWNPDTGLGNINGTGLYVRALGGDVDDELAGTYTRQDSWTRYLKPYLGRVNLEVITGATVVSVGKQGACPAANGATCINSVTYVKDNLMYSEKVVEGGKIILSAGVFGTTHILQRSGIGNCDDLATKDVECVKNLINVGAKIYDHIVFAQIYLTPASATWATHRGSIVATYYSSVAGGDINIESSYTTFPASPATQALLVSNTLTQPQSFGSISLRSKDLFAPLNITFGVLSNAADIAPLIVAFKKTRQAAAALGLPEISPGAAAVSSTATDTQIATWLASNAKANYHTVGSTPMGVCNGEVGAVVDDRLHVCGVSGLMIADNGVMPFPYTAHSTHTGALIIGEQAARFA